MTIKSLLFILFLCLCLIWAIAVYRYTGPEIMNHGLLWTILLLAAVLILVIGSRLFGWWRIWRAKRPMQPAAVAKPLQPVHEDDAAMIALIAEANATLAKAPNYTALPGRSPLSRLPLYLLIGPEAAGKTATFLNSGVEPQFLAGQPGAASTRLCNLWLAKSAIFAEFSGRVFGGDGERWAALLQILQGRTQLTFWQRLWREPSEGMTLRGVIGFCDVRELSGASADPQRLERGCRGWQDRLKTVGQVFGGDFPVYQVFTKCDKLPFFPDYFGRLPEAEINQVLGCTLPFRRPDSLPAGEAFVEVEAKRLTAAFRPLYQSLAERRLSHLAHEPNPARKPGIYEFPRELKRIRQPLVQFLTDVFRPNQLQYLPVLRGFYLTGIQEVETAKTKPMDEAEWTTPNLNLETTRLFQGGDATRIFKQDDADRDAPARGRSALKTRWLFVSDLFHQIVLADRPPISATLVQDVRFIRYRQGVLGAVCMVCFLLCVAFITSWANNHTLLAKVADAGHAVPRNQGSLGSPADLQALDKLREQVQLLQEGPGMSYHWGLYKGKDIRDEATRAYFARFRELLLTGLNEAMLSQLRALSPAPNPNDPWDPAYTYLKTHLMISSGSCKSDPAFVSRTLKQVRSQLPADANPEWRDLANRQIDFYAQALGHGNPVPLPEETATRDHARQYLNGIKGIEPIYRSILAKAETSVTAQKLEDLAANYRTVLSSKADISPAFSQKGWQFVEDASKKANSGTGAESCVLGKGAAPTDLLANDSAVAIQALFIRDYMTQWRNYVAGFSVLPFGSPADAAKKLSILADHKSPLLALFYLTASQTDFTVPAATGVVATITSKVAGVFDNGKKKAESVTGAQPDAPHQATLADIPLAFQPVHSVVPPNSPTWEVDKNAAYMDGLRKLAETLQNIAASPAPDPALYQAGQQAAAGALGAAQGIESKFKPMGVQGLDLEVQRLLEEPIRFAMRLLQVDITEAGGNKVNKALAEVCGQMRGTLHKYPFQSKPAADMSLAELTAAFAPASKIWQFAAGPLAEFAGKEGGLWKSKDPAKKPQVTPELLTFLNKAQAIASGFFAGNPSQPGFSFVVRPNLSQDFGDEEKFDLELNGKSYLWDNVIQKTILWPGEAGSTPQAQAQIVGKVSYPFDARSGLWGLFQILSDAEPRAMGEKNVEWRYSFGPDGSKTPIKVNGSPRAVKIVIVSFPGDSDIFNPDLYRGMTCPNKAVQ